MKKAVGILLIIFVAAACCMVVLTRGRFQFRENKPLWDYRIENNNTIVLTKYHGKEAVPVIPLEIDGVQVSSLGEGVFSGNKRIKEISIPESISLSGKSIFEDCIALKLVILPSDIVSIPERTFYGCSNLRVIQLPYGLQTIEAQAFSGCADLAYLDIPDSVTYIGAEAFLNCSALAEMIVSRNLDDVGLHAFRGTVWLQNQKDEFVIIGNQILIKYNGSADYVDIPKGVIRITDAFEDNIFPIEIYLPESVLSIGARAFAGCRSLETINFPEKVQLIGESAFRRCTHLRSVELPGLLTKIGTAAFQGCSALNYLKIPDGVEDLPALVFANCEKLDVLEIPPSVKSISDDIVLYSGISEFYVGKGTEGEAFAERKGIPYQYSEWEGKPFDHQRNADFSAEDSNNSQNNLETITERSLSPSVGESGFSGVLLTNYSGPWDQIELPEKTEDGLLLTGLADQLFMGYKLSSIIIPDGYEYIGARCFAENPGLLEITIPKTVTYISDDCFEGTNVTIWGYNGSYAETYARQHKIKFLVIFEWNL